MKDAKHTISTSHQAVLDALDNRDMTGEIQEAFEAYVAARDAQEAAPGLAEAIIQTAKERAFKRWLGSDSAYEFSENMWPRFLRFNERAALTKAGLLTEETTEQ